MGSGDIFGVFMGVVELDIFITVAFISNFNVKVISINSGIARIINVFSLTLVKSCVRSSV